MVPPLVRASALLIRAAGLGEADPPDEPARDRAAQWHTAASAARMREPGLHAGGNAGRRRLGLGARARGVARSRTMNVYVRGLG